MSKRNIYLIPGLGYDCRIFEKLDFQNHSVNKLNWKEPHKDEALKEYAKRLFQDLPDRGGKITLIGHSFGGMLAQVIAAVKEIEQIILISSIQSRNEMPLTFKLVKPLKLYPLFTKEISVRTIKYWGKNHGFTHQEDLELFKSMLALQSNHYLQWALKALSNWQRPTLPPGCNLFQIHGTADKTFPFKLIQSPNAVIPNGSHIMVWKKPAIISESIQEAL